MITHYFFMKNKKKNAPKNKGHDLLDSTQRSLSVMMSLETNDVHQKDEADLRKC